MSVDPAADTQQLIERIRAGDREALEFVLCRELPALRAYVRLRAGPLLRARESTSDLVQSTCREVLGKLDTFQYGGEAGFRDWLFATAMRKIANRVEHAVAQKRDIRRDRPLPNDSSSEEREQALAAIYSTLGSPSRNAIASETRDAMEAAFDRLPEDRREIIVLARVVGLDHASIAERLGCTTVSARQRLFRALAELADGLGSGPQHQRPRDEDDS
jgi:RNA polymerase sigma-70 factor, ECF subfamily